MLATYIDQAMELARYEIIEDEGTYWGAPRSLGCKASGPWLARRAGAAGDAGGLSTRTARGAERTQLGLSDWMALRLRLGLPIPVLAGIDLNQMLPQPT